MVEAVDCAVRYAQVSQQECDSARAAALHSSQQQAEVERNAEQLSRELALARDGCAPGAVAALAQQRDNALAAQAGR